MRRADLFLEGNVQSSAVNLRSCWQCVVLLLNKNISGTGARVSRSIECVWLLPTFNLANLPPSNVTLKEPKGTISELSRKKTIFRLFRPGLTLLTLHHTGSTILSLPRAGGYFKTGPWSDHREYGGYGCFSSGPAPTTPRPFSTRSVRHFDQAESFYFGHRWRVCAKQHARTNLLVHTTAIVQALYAS